MSSTSPSKPPESQDSPQVASLPAGPSQSKKSFLDRLPPWVATNIRSKQSRKMLFRCWLGSWAAFVIILPDKTLRTMGNACVSYSLQGDLQTISMILWGATMSFTLIPLHRCYEQLRAFPQFCTRALDRPMLRAFLCAHRFQLLK
jgi:hypothetical protein